jgi:16S rRNA (cytidine1402-2'-O)-methyltransferase
VLGAGRPATLCREITKLHETFDRGSLGDLARRYAEAPIKGEVVIVVAPPGPAAPPVQSDVDGQLAEALRTMSVKEAAQSVAEATGLSRRDLYQQALALKAAT